MVGTILCALAVPRARLETRKEFGAWISKVGRQVKMEGREIRVLLVSALVSVALCGADDGYCTEDSCSEGTELQDIGETSFQWWNLYEMGKYIINTIKFNVYRKIEQAQNVTTAIVESLEAKVNSALHGFERFLNRTVKFAEELYNKTAEFAGEVYDKIIEEFAEKVRDVLREEFDNFLGLLWGEGSLGPIGMLRQTRGRGGGVASILHAAQNAHA